MSTAFLDALRQKSAQQQNGRGNTDPNNGPVLISDLIKSNQGKKYAPLIVNVERVLNKNRLDVTFSRYPGDLAIKTLKEQGFRSRKDGDQWVWFHFDGTDNRAFCTKEYGAVFDDDDDSPPITPANNQVNSAANPVLNTPVNAPVSNTQPIPESDAKHTPEYETFKRQVNELIEYIKIEPADLMLLAIDTLHKKVFGKDA